MHIYLFYSILNSWGHIATVPNFTNVLPHRNAMPQTQDMTPHLITVYRHRTRHPTSSQYTDTEHDTPPHHSIETQDMTPHLITVYRHRTRHPTSSITVYRHRTRHPTSSQYTYTGHDNPPRLGLHTQDCRCAIH